MIHLRLIRFIRNVIITFSAFVIFSSCDRTSSPEGRMSIKMENVQKEMIDSLRQQNKAILDSLGKIREELKEIRQAKQ